MINLKNAIEFAKKTKIIRKGEMARTMWNDSSSKSASNNFSSLINGKRRSIQIDHVIYLCKELGVTADYLFGLENVPTRFEAVEEKKRRMEEALKLAQDTIADLKEEIETL